MTITLQAVNELIASLESAGELSIREQKFLKLAKAFKQLAAENVALKNAFGPGDSVLNFLTIALRHTTYDRIDLDDVTLAFKMSLPETPATDRIVAVIKADGVDMVLDLISHTKGMLYADSVKDVLSEVSSKLREGDDK
ncbi:TPA: hypothetical protein RQ687_004085 [Klebsiella pneumoniae]|uniref:hypothetical protein n=1 Tax=Klebsiella pneumoniae TaxID=573 RepID=UPI0028C12BB6|nr:hypothetical protein [Klebsiella pneumoniae]HDY5331971.1 hypothetical protein [Klebsiella pneumoniae]